MGNEDDDTPSFSITSGSDHKYGPGFEYDDEKVAESIRNGPLRQKLIEDGVMTPDGEIVKNGDEEEDDE